MELETYIVNAFADAPGRGNRAGVVVSPEHPPEDVMQIVAADIGASETAFVAPEERAWNIRWFSPLKEMSLCGHATLAASRVLFGKEPLIDSLVFRYAGGILPVQRYPDDSIGMDFPLDDYMRCPPVAAFDDFFGPLRVTDCICGRRTGKVIIVTDEGTDLRTIAPDFNRMVEYRGLCGSGIAVTKASSVYDFESRYFNPWAGVNEDPVTGSVHTVLARYWSERLEKKTLAAFQNSSRPGELLLTVGDDRVEIRGKARIVLQGTFFP
ncbi:PhzF family phenazine biosynthesis isomerase [Aminivibrio sp.]|jgi:predicted PhzF superfamily epimerase YddE/YHI9|uniref:PhzF family phenazine biosynthesis protein n=1 Tax=Aminivibrio sp. TaxID=1872489 RepID=UPI001A372FCB|nr:PhzF family phenazine biosynthesis isomerase [Aminivibrio sp.]MBL3538404.1 PhzF family phenazine biosynthesis isomerase [Aminivibrio sp.]MDK2959456.1 hypothetical protein [Synergistaceae bacterium]